MKKYLQIAIACFLLVSQSFAQQTTPNGLAIYMKNNLPAITKRVRSIIGSSRYMEEKFIEKRTDLKGWEGITVSLYEYNFPTTNPKVKLPAKVYLCDASYEQIAKWVITACWLSKGAIADKDINRLIHFINGQSGGQFPVMGIVYEDMNNEGIQTPWVFKDGVTVFPSKLFLPKSKVLTGVQLDSALHLTNDLLKPSTGQYARICGTTREQYKKAGGTDDVGSSVYKNRKISWLATTKALYQKALTNDNNELITAWAKSNL